MSSVAEIEFVKVLVGYLNENRPAGLPEMVTRKDGTEGKLSLLREDEVDPRVRPCVVFVSEGVDMPHPKLARLTLSVETLFAVDDFTAEEAAGWVAVIDAVLSDRPTIFPILSQAMCEADGVWRFKDIRVVSGAGENEGQRSRGLRDGWSVWLLKRDILT